MQKLEIYLILNNIRSAYNVGSIFRTADGAGVKKIYLCGITPTPGGPQYQVSSSKYQAGDKISKTALGAEKIVPWEYHAQAWRLLSKLKNKNEKLKIIALERFDKLTASKLKVKNLFKYKLSSLVPSPLALMVGNEVRGLSPKILEYVDDIIEIPMYGKKESLNVAVATGIAVYTLIRN
ncbi:MAG: TrmH family RNA methyltransferase [bacterium]|nr:TrmH family RNA methyltransferase [bacterium]